jgi:hypothetical protein
MAGKKPPRGIKPARVAADNAADDTAEKYAERAEQAAARIAAGRSSPERYQLAGPAALRTGIGIIHRENAIALLQKIYADCGAEAVEYICKDVLEAIQAERIEERAGRHPRRKSGPHDHTRRFQKDWTTAWVREQKYLRAPLAEVVNWIFEARQFLHQGKAKSPQEAKAVREYVRLLEQRRDGLVSGKIKTPTIKEARDKLPPPFVNSGFYGKPPKGVDAGGYVTEKLRTAGRPPGRRQRKSKTKLCGE